MLVPLPTFEIVRRRMVTMNRPSTVNQFLVRVTAKINLK